MKTTFISLLIVLTCTASTCKKEHGSHTIITFKNNSSDTIICRTKYQGKITSDYTLYDCSAGAPTTYKIEPFKQQDISSGSETWEMYFDEIPYVQFFIVSNTVYQRVVCDTIRKYNMILRHYQLSLEDLERMNWTVTYP